MTEPSRADSLILFGITGDLARKKLFSALYDLTAAGRLDMPVVGVASRDWNDEALRLHAREALEATGRLVADDVFVRLAANLCYVSGDYRDPATYADIAKRAADSAWPRLVSRHPARLVQRCGRGTGVGRPHRRGRLILEKPFGRDVQSAAGAQRHRPPSFPEGRVYRIDHFLGKEAVQNLMIFRFSNTVLEPIWNRHYVRGVQITMAEDFGVEGRGTFYDKVGTLRDVVQNHLLQVLALLAMEPPVSEDPDALRDERVKALRAIITPDSRDVVRGQYSGFREEPGVAVDSDTETFAAVRLELDSWRWAGVALDHSGGEGLGFDRNRSGR